MNTPSRRRFLKSTALAGAAVVLGVTAKALVTKKEFPGGVMFVGGSDVTDPRTQRVMDYVGNIESDDNLLDIARNINRWGLSCKFRPSDNPVSEIMQGRFVLEITAPSLMS
jgi:hypothetical protein